MRVPQVVKDRLRSAAMVLLAPESLKVLDPTPAEPEPVDPQWEPCPAMSSGMCAASRPFSAHHLSSTGVWYHTRVPASPQNSSGS